MIQFKLVDKESQKKLNTLTFLNAPMARVQDSNICTL